MEYIHSIINTFGKIFIIQTFKSDLIKNKRKIKINFVIRAHVHAVIAVMCDGDTLFIWYNIINICNYVPVNDKNQYIEI